MAYPDTPSYFLTLLMGVLVVRARRRYSAVLASQNVDGARDESGDDNGKHDKLADQTIAQRNPHRL